MRRTHTLFLSASLLTGIANAQPAYDYINVNQVDALISASGNHFWDFSSNHYFVPKDSGTTSLFASTLWIGAQSDSGLHLSADRFRQNGGDFTPGPVSDNEAYNEPAYSEWDRVWVVTKQEIQQWLDDPYNNDVPQSVLEWPAHGDEAKGQAYYLAPFVDVNQDGEYDPVNDFDHPKMYGDQMVYFIYNDDASLNFETGGQQLRVEVHGVAYAFDCPADTALNHAVFFKHWIYNRSENDYTETYLGIWNDIDLGNAQDDYIGCDPLRNVFYAYNGDNEDQDAGGQKGYGFNLPSQGVRLLQGPLMAADGEDNDPALQDSIYNGFGMNDGTVDNERLGLFGVMTHQNASGPTGDPSIATDYYNYMRAKWRDGTPITFGGNGYDPADTNAVRVRFVFPDPDDSLFYTTGGVHPDSIQQGSWPWTEVNAGNTPADRRMLGSIGAFDLPAGESADFDHVYVFAQKYEDRIGAMYKMKRFSDEIQEHFDLGTTDCGDFEPTFVLSNPGVSEERFDVFPNPAKDHIRVNGLKERAKVKVYTSGGQLTIQESLERNASMLNVSSLPKGVYLIEIETEHSSKTTRLVKM